MSRQLDILALEPYFGGARKSMLQTLVRCSRHRWTLLTLPPRRMERRLAAAAHWFSEQIARRDVGAVDVLFTCDALNLADLYRLCPTVVDHPSVVYFHCNQLPDPLHHDPQAQLDLTNLNTATAANEIWFNSTYHARSFIEAVEGLVASHAELQTRNPVADLNAKLRCVHPPVDMARTDEIIAQAGADRDPNAIYLETGDGNIELLNAALGMLFKLKHKINLFVCGPVDRLANGFPVQMIHETDIDGQINGLLKCSTFVSAKIAPTFDETAIRAMQLGCRPVLPHTGIYPEIVPHAFHSECLYDMSAESLSGHIHEALFTLAMYSIDELTSKLGPFNAPTACHKFDERLDSVAAAHLLRSSHHKPNRHDHLRRAIPNA